MARPLRESHGEGGEIRVVQMDYVRKLPKDRYVNSAKIFGLTVFTI